MDHRRQRHPDAADADALDVRPAWELARRFGVGLRIERVEGEAFGELHPDSLCLGVRERPSLERRTQECGARLFQRAPFVDPAALFALIAELQAKYKQAMVVQTTEVEGKTLYKLFMGKFQNRAYADALKTVLGNKFSDSFVVKYE